MVAGFHSPCDPELDKCKKLDGWMDGPIGKFKIILWCGIEVIRLWRCSGVTEAQVALIATFSLSVLCWVGYFFIIFLAINHSLANQAQQ